MRAIDCPEETIRDIIIADVNKLYAPREAPFKKPADPLATPEGTAASSETAVDLSQRKRDFERRKKLREVEMEKAAVVKDLLGIDLALGPLEGWHTRNYDRHQTALDALPGQKRETVRALQGFIGRFPTC